MDKRSLDEIMAYLSAHGASSPRRNSHPTLQPWPTDSKAVQRLKKALQAIADENINLREQSKFLKDELNILKDDQQTEVNNLNKELKQKNLLLKNTVRKRRMRTRAYIDTLHLLTKRELELQQREQHWTSIYNDLQSKIQNMRCASQYEREVQEQQEDGKMGEDKKAQMPEVEMEKIKYEGEEETEVEKAKSPRKTPPPAICVTASPKREHDAGADEFTLLKYSKQQRDYLTFDWMVLSLLQNIQQEVLEEHEEQIAQSVLEEGFELETEAEVFKMESKNIWGLDPIQEEVEEEE